MARRFTQIKGLSENRRLPRMGKIRLGIRVKKKAEDNRCKHDKDATCNFCTYPRETEYFVVPPEVAKVYGEKPTELDIMLPVNDLNIIFPQAYEMYGSGRGLFCSGDGETAIRLNTETKSFDERKCPCEYLEQKKCSQRAHLLAILPKVSPGGVYQFDTGSINSIIDINSSLEYVQAMIGRFAMVQLKIKRIPMQTHHDGKKQTHYTMKIEPVGDFNDLKLLRSDKETIFLLPEPPEHVNPAVDGPTVDEEPEPVTATEVVATRKKQAAEKPKETAKSSDGGKICQHCNETFYFDPATKDEYILREGAGRITHWCNKPKRNNEPPIEGQAERVPNDNPTGSGPTEQDLLTKIENATNPDELNQCLADAEGLPDQARTNVRKAVIARGRTGFGQRAAS